MELRTGRLMALAAVAVMAEGWAQVPADMERMARDKMRIAAMFGAEPAVNMRGQHPLAKWGRDKRKEKAKAKTATASRRKNRK